MALTEALEVRTRLADVAEKLETTQKLISHSEGRAPMAALEAGQQRQPLYTVTRVVDGVSETRIAQETDMLQPGDILRVGVDKSKGRVAGSRPESVDAASMTPSAGTGPGSPSAD